MGRTLCYLTMEGKMFVLLSLPEVDEVEDYLTDYLEAILDTEVDCFVFNPHIPDRVLVTMTEVMDMSHVTCEISKNAFAGRTLTVEAPDFGNSLIVTSTDLLHEYALTFLKSYFERECADGEEVVSSFFQLPQSKMSVFSFTDVEVLKRVMACKLHYVPFPEEKYEVHVEPFFHNFHGHIPINDKLLNNVLQGERSGSHTGNMNLQNQSLGANDDLLKDGGPSEDVRGPNCLENHPTPIVMSISEMDGSNAQPCTVFEETLQSKEAKCEENPQSFKRNDIISIQGDEVVLYNKEEDLLKYRISESEWKLLQSRIGLVSVKLEYNCDKALLVVKGKNAHDFLKNLEGLQSHIHYKSESIGKDTQILLTSLYAKEYLTSQFPDVQWYFQRGYLHIYAFNTSAVEEFQTKIRHLKIDFEKAALKNKLSEEDQTLYKKYAGRFSLVQISSNAKWTTIVGVQKRTFATVEKLKFCSFGEESLGRQLRRSDIETIHRTSFEFSDFYYKFLYTHHKDELDEALKCVASSSVSTKCGKAFIQLSGDAPAVKKACGIIKTILHSIEAELKKCLEYFAQSDVV